MNLQPFIRESEGEDAKAIQRVSRASWHAAYDAILGADTVDDVIDEWYDVDRLQTAIERSIFYVAEVDGEVVGFANAGPNPEYEEGRFELFRIYVLPEHWNQGIGGRLLEWVCAGVREEGGSSLRLSVLAENDVGVRFYESKGFERIEEGVIELDGEPYQEFVYTKHL